MSTAVLQTIPLQISQTETGCARVTGRQAYSTDDYNGLYQRAGVTLKELNGKRIAIRNWKPTFKAWYGDTTEDDIEVDTVEISWEEAFVGEMKIKYNQIGDPEHQDAFISLSPVGQDPFENNGRLFRPFERTYLLNTGRVAHEDLSTDLGFDSYTFGDFDWLNINPTGGWSAHSLTKRKDEAEKAAASLARYLSVDGDGYVPKNNTIAQGHKMYSEISKQIANGLLPGAPALNEANFAIHNGGLKENIQIDTTFITNVLANSSFLQMVQLVESYTSTESDDDEKMVQTERLVCKVQLTNAQQIAYNEIPGQDLQILVEDVSAPAVVSSISNNELMFVMTPGSAQDLAAIKTNFAAPGDTKEMRISYGTDGNRVSDLNHTIRMQGLGVGEDQFTVQADREVRLFPGDYVQSFSSADDQQHYSRIAITSQDLLVQPVISSGFRSLLLHSFPLPHEYSASVDNNFNVTSASSGILGVMHWRDKGGEAIVHPITMGSASLRHFSISAALLPRDTASVDSQQILLPPGGLFQVTLCFMKDFTAK